MSTWAAVIGSPIGHSLSPVLHRRAYELVGLDWEYRRYEVTAEALPSFVAELDEDCVGLSVTMPGKQVLARSADTVDGLAKAVGSANTLVIAGGLKACFNTDVHGIVEALRATSAEPLSDLASENRRREATAVILGTGATAASALAAVTTLGIGKVSVIGRNFQGAGNITRAANRLHLEFDSLYWKWEEETRRVVAEADVVISTVPGEVSASLAEAVIPREGQRFLDVTYARGVTPLTEAFAQAGAQVASPLAMLVYQGLAQVKLMSGREAPFEPVYQAVAAAATG